MDRVTRFYFTDLVMSGEVSWESNGQSGIYPDCEWVTVKYANGEVKDLAVIREVEEQ